MSLFICVNALDHKANVTNLKKKNLNHLDGEQSFSPGPNETQETIHP